MTGDRCRTSSARFGTRCVCGPSPRAHPLFLLSPTSPAADTPVCVSSLRNIIIKTCPKMSGATLAPCQKDTSRTLHAVTLACSSTCTLSSPTHPSAKSPCFGRTLILMTDHLITHYLLYRLCIIQNVLLAAHVHVYLYFYFQLFAYQGGWLNSCFIRPGPDLRGLIWALSMIGMTRTCPEGAIKRCSYHAERTSTHGSIFHPGPSLVLS